MFVCVVSLLCSLWCGVRQLHGLHPNMARSCPAMSLSCLSIQDVVWRVGSSFLGPLKPDFMSVTMTSPDLYGPFWVATTLIFVTAGAKETHPFSMLKGRGG
jgi:hypothetical protein